MYASSKNETQIQHKMHFHKTVQDLPIYNIHKNFGALDTSDLSVENIINTVFFNCEDKKHAQICAQTYICQRIISKATELKLTAIFYQDPYERSRTLYEEPAYVLVKKQIAGIAKNILSHPVIFLLNRCSEPLKKRKIKTPKQKKQKNGRSYAFDKSLNSIVGKFPTLIIRKLSPKEIENHMKAKYRIFDLEKNSITMKNDKTLKKTKLIKSNKENLLQNAVIRRSSRLSSKKEKIALNVQKNFQDNFSVVSETNLLEDNQQVETELQKDTSVSIITETHLQEDCQHNETYFGDNKLGKTRSHTNYGTTETHYPMDDRLVIKHLQENNKCFSIAETNSQKDNDLFKVYHQIPENVENSSDEIVDNGTHYVLDDTTSVESQVSSDELNFPENNKACEFGANKYGNEDTENMFPSEQDKCYESMASLEEEECNDEYMVGSEQEKCYDESTASSEQECYDESMVHSEQEECFDESMVHSEQEGCFDETMVSSEPEKYCERVSTVHLRGNYTFELVVKTRLGVTEDTCKHLEDELGLDKDVMASLRELYKSVHNGKNNYTFCELSY